MVGWQHATQSPEYGAYMRRAERLQRRSAKEFSRALDRAKQAAASGRPELAVGWCHYAASAAWFVNPGFVYCQEMEQLLAEIGRKVLKPAPALRPSAEAPRRFLHVVSTAAQKGGDTRALACWIENCAQHAPLEHHSILISMQGNEPLPAWLRDTTEGAGGEFVQFPPGMPWLQMATEIRSRAWEFDVVVLHTHPNDPLPNLAFHDQPMPVLYFDNGDQQFILGMDVAQVVTEGLELDFALRYRSPRPKKLLLPLPLLDEEQALCSQAEAREKLGLPADALIALTIGEAYKFESIYGFSFAPLVQSLCAENSRLLVVAVGISKSEPFPELSEQTGGRFMPVGRVTERGILELYYRAADVYLDSYPTGSLTAAIDAGRHGLPVQRLAIPNQTFLLSNDPALDSVMRGVPTPEEFVAGVLEWLNWPEEKRLELGGRFRAAVLRDHCGASWKLNWLDPAVKALQAPIDEPSASSRQRTDGDENPLLKLAGGEYSAGWPTGMLVAWSALYGPLPLRIRLSGVLRSIKPLLFDADRNFRKRLLMFTWLMAKCLPRPIHSSARAIYHRAFKKV